MNLIKFKGYGEFVKNNRRNNPSLKKKMLRSNKTMSEVMLDIYIVSRRYSWGHSLTAHLETF